MDFKQMSANRKGILYAVLAILFSAHAVAQQADNTIQSIERNKVDKTPTSIYFSATTNWQDNQAQEIFKKYLGIDGGDNTMVQAYSTTSKSGITAKRYNQYFKGVQVAYASYSLTCKNGRVNFITGNFYNIDKAATAAPSLSEGDAFNKAIAFVGADKYMWEDPREEQRVKALFHKPDTTFKPKGVLRFIEDFRDGKKTKEVHLAWCFSIYAQQPLSRQEVYIDAATGNVLYSNPLIKHTAATGNTVYSGAVTFETSNLGTTYELFDSTRGSGVHTLNMNNGSSYGAATEYTSVTNTWNLLPEDSIALDAHWGAEVVYDYWKTVQGRLSYDNADGVLLQYVHYQTGYNNAFWDGVEMTYGDGSGCSSGFDPLASLDVTGHEIGHGVCEYTANLVYEMESGAMNESFSDCWGTTIEVWGNPMETDAVSKSMWSMGEEIDCGSPLRRLDFPKLKGDPDTYGGTNWVDQVSCTPTSGNDHCGVHTNSGVMNKWYFLVVSGGTGTNDLTNAYNVTGIGFAEGANILYQTELILSSTADYAEMRTASINTATTLYGGCSQETITVTNAWYAVGVGPAYVPFPANITGGTSICVGGSTTLSDATGGGIWSSSFPAIATVTAGGFVSGLTAGIDTIIYSVGIGCDAKAIVTVNAFPVATITPSPTAILCIGSNALLTANPGVGFTYQWKLGGSNIAGATNDTYAATVTGNYTVLVNNSASCSATSSITTVSAVAPPAATITPASSTTFCSGNNVVLNANLGIGLTYQWLLGGVSIAGATGSGYTASAGGNYSVMVTNSSGCSTTSGNTAVVVNPLPAPISGATTLCVSLTTALSDASPAGTWSSSNTAIATVGGGSGIVSGVAAGTANITYTLGTGCYTSIPVLVNSFPSAISGASGVCVGSSTTLSNTVPGGAWSSNNSAIASVGTGSGSVSGVAAGTAIISYTMGAGCFVIKNITVNPLPATISGVLSVCSGSITTLSDASPGGTWTSGATSTATVTPVTGDVTGVGGGTVNITYTLPTGCLRSAMVTVNTVSAPPISGATSVCLGQSIILSDAVPGGSWSSSNTAIATVSGTGSVFGVSVGVVNITYTVTNPCGTAFTTRAIVVNALPVVAAISGSLSVCSGNSTTLSDATPGGIWSSGNLAVATISSTTGVVTGVTVGTANISYSVTNASGCTGSAVSAFNVISTFSVIITPAGPINFCTGASVFLSTTTGAGYTYQWKKNGANITGATTSGYTASTTGTYTILVTAPGGCNSLSAPVAITVNPSPVVVPAVSITAHPGLILCVSTRPDTFTATASNGGSSPAYQWYVNSAPVSSGPAYIYTPVHGDIIRCVLTSSDVCAYPVTASWKDTVKISPAYTPGVTIVPNHSSVCFGDTITFNAVSSYGGTAPTFLWTQNGINVGTGSSYTYKPSNGDILRCSMLSNYPCLLTPGVTSAPYVVSVQPIIPNTISIYATQPGVATGMVDTFVAVAPYAGSSPVYKWRVNGLVIAGVTTATFITSSLVNGDIVSCEVTSSNPCVYPGTVMSGGLRVNVWGLGVQHVRGSAGSTFMLNPNPNKGIFTISGSLSNSADVQVHITITNLLGQVMYQQNAMVRNGNLDEKVIMDNGTASGMYLVSITAGEEHVVFHMALEK